MGQLAQFDQQLAQAKSVKDLFQLKDVKERAIKNYELTTGRKDGENRFEQERFAYLQILADKPDLKQVDNFYHFSAIVYALSTGLSFRDNKLYVIPAGKGLKIQSSPSGKREMLEMMPDVKSAPQPVLVMVGDLFVVDKQNSRVTKHESTEKTKEDPKLENIRAAYQRINFKDDTYVDTIVYHDDLVKAKSKSKVKSETSFWNEWPGPACEKVSTNRAFRVHHKYPENVVIYGNVDKDDDQSDTQYADVEVVDTETVDTDTGEVTQTPLPNTNEDANKSFM